MTQDEARPLILDELRKRLPTVPYEGTDGGLVQYNQLKQERPDLFGFRSSAEKWQVVKGWMNRAGLVR